ncbi:MAG: ribokinase, partial [Deltaproteobacteria bacterium]
MLDVISIGALNVDLIARVSRFPVADEEVAVQDLEIF